MSTLGTLRSDLATLLGTATGFTANDHAPGRLTVPAVFILPGSPYVEAGNTFGSFRVRLTATLAVTAVNNETASSGLDDAVEEAIIAAVNGGWGVEKASEPYALEANGGQLAVTNIDVVIDGIRL